MDAAGCCAALCTVPARGHERVRSRGSTPPRASSHVPSGLRTASSTVDTSPGVEDVVYFNKFHAR